MKSGVLVGFPHFDSLREAEAMARDLNTAYRHPEYPKEVKFAATKIPSDTPIRIHREDHSIQYLLAMVARCGAQVYESYRYSQGQGVARPERGKGCSGNDSLCETKRRCECWIRGTLD